MPKIKTKSPEEVNDNSQRSQLDSMLNRGRPEKEEEPKEPEAHEPEVDEPEVQDPEVEEPEQQEPVQEEPEEEKVSVEDQLRQRIAELETSKPLKEESKQPEKPQEQQIPEDEEIQIEDFITEAEMEEVQADPRKMNEVLLRVYKRAVSDTSEKVLQKIPQIVQASSARQVTLQEAVRKFYTDNPDLRNHAQYVGYVANQIKAQNPDLPVQDIFKQTEQKVRTDLSLTKKAREKEGTRTKGTENNNSQPAFARRSSGNHKGGKQDVRNEFQKQADEMIKSLR